MATDSPTPDPGWFNHLLGFIKGIGGSVLELARLTFGGDGSGGRLVFFAVGMVGLVCLATFPLFAIRDQMTHLLISFGILAVVVLVLVCRIAWRLDGQPSAQPGFKPSEVGAELSDARTERDAARADLVVARSGLDKETKRVAVLAALNKAYEFGVAEISRHYQQVPKRFPAVLENEIVVTVTYDAAAEVAERRRLNVSGKSPQSFLIAALTGTTPIESFLDLDFRLVVHSTPAERVVWLPAQGRPSQHEVLFMFLPPLRAGEADVDFSVTWTWPDVFRDLQNPSVKRDFFGTKIRTSAPVPVVRLVFRIHVSVPPLKLSNKGTVPGAPTAPAPHHLSPDYRVYQWEAYNVSDEAQVAVWLDWL